MNDKLSTIIAVMVLAIGLSGWAIAKQETRFDEDYAKLGDAEIWNLIKKCNDRKKLESLIHHIPISVMAEHAIQAYENPKQGPSFGKFVYQVIWTELIKDGQPYVHAKRLFKVLHWSDTSGQYSVDASIFDVRQESVFLKKEDGSLVVVPIEKLSDASRIRLRHYERIRKKFIERLPERPALFAGFDEKQMPGQRAQSPPNDQQPVAELVETPMSANWQNQAAVVLAFKSVDDMFSETSYLIESAGFKELVFLWKTVLDQYTIGVDRKKPAGAVLMFDGETPVVVGCLPVTDFDDTLDTIAGFAEIEEGKKGDFDAVIFPGGAEIFTITQNGWAFFSESKEVLASLPADPGAIFLPSTNQYMISISSRWKNFPKSLLKQMKEGATDGIKSLSETSLGRPFLLPLMVAGAQIMGDSDDLISEIDRITLGWAIDRKGRRSYLDFRIAAQEDTLLAKRIEATGALESRFAGFARENAAVSMHWAANLIEDDQAHLISMNAAIRKQMLKVLTETELPKVNELNVIKEIVGLWLDELSPVIESGKIDGAGSIALDDNTVDFIAGVYATEDSKVEESIKLLMERIAADDNDAIEIELNVDSFGEVNFHKFHIAIPKNDERANKAFGSELEIVIGAGPEAVYFGAGANSVESIKSAVAQSRDESRIQRFGMQYKTSIHSVLEYAFHIERNHILRQMADLLKGSESDAVTVSLQTVGLEQTIRIEVQEAVLGLIKIVVDQAFGSGHRGGDF